MCCSAVLLAGGVDERCPRSASRYFLGTLNVQCVPHPLFMQSNAENPHTVACLHEHASPSPHHPHKVCWLPLSFSQTGCGTWRGPPTLGCP